MPRFDWNRTTPPAVEPLLPSSAERWGARPDDHLVVHGDNLAALAALLPIHEGRVRLVCIDPPFFTGKSWTMGFPGLEREEVAFADNRFGGIDGYLDFLHHRIVLLHRLLMPEGTIFVHLDYRAAHYVRLVLEEVFGSDRLLNEIIWSYASGGGSSERFGRKHDTILWFAKGDGHVFHRDAVRVPYRAAIAPSRRSLFHENGMVCPDVWEISRGRNGDGATGYPTEKPHALVHRMIVAASNEGDLVLDAFAGSGSVAEAAAACGRRSISIDASPLAIQCHRRRLSLAEVGFTVLSQLPAQERGLSATIETHGVESVVTLGGDLPEDLDGWALDEADSAEAPLRPVWVAWRGKKNRRPELASDRILLTGSKALFRLSVWTIDGARFFALMPASGR